MNREAFECPNCGTALAMPRDQQGVTCPSCASVAYARVDVDHRLATRTSAALAQLDQIAARPHDPPPAAYQAPVAVEDFIALQREYADFSRRRQTALDDIERQLKNARNTLKDDEGEEGQRAPSVVGMIGGGVIFALLWHSGAAEGHFWKTLGGCLFGGAMLGAMIYMGFYKKKADADARGMIAQLEAEQADWVRREESYKDRLGRRSNFPL